MKRLCTLGFAVWSIASAGAQPAPGSLSLSQQYESMAQISSTLQQFESDRLLRTAELYRQTATLAQLRASQINGVANQPRLAEELFGFGGRAAAVALRAGRPDLARQALAEGAFQAGAAALLYERSQRLVMREGPGDDSDGPLTRPLLPPPGPTGATVGVSPYTHDHPAAALLLYTRAPGTPGASFNASCSGSLVTPDLVLTAAHCLCVTEAARIATPAVQCIAGPQSGRDHRRWRVFFQHAGLRQVVRAELAASFEWDSVVKGDVALLWLDRPVPTITPLRLPPTPSPPSSWPGGIAVGFGQSAVRPSGPGQVLWVPPGLKTAMQITGGDCGSITNFGTDQNWHLCWRFEPGASSATICAGDSGGPLFVTDARQIGVATGRNERDNCGAEISQAIQTRLARREVHDFLRANGALSATPAATLPSTGAVPNDRALLLPGLLRLPPSGRWEDTSLEARRPGAVVVTANAATQSNHSPTMLDLEVTLNGVRQDCRNAANVANVAECHLTWIEQGQRLRIAVRGPADTPLQVTATVVSPP